MRHSTASFDDAPERPADLARHRLVTVEAFYGRREWLYSKAGRVETARIAPRLAVNTVAAAVDAALAGWGVTRVLSYQAADAIAEGRLVEVLAGCDDRELPVQLVHAEGRRAPAKTRAFLDFAAKRLRAAAAHLAAV